MYLKQILPAAFIILLAACNSSSKDKGNEEDTTAMNDMDHNMPMPTGNVPAIPAVPENARVFFKNLKEGAIVKSPFKVEMGTDNFRVDTAGPVVDGGGHHHLLIDAEDSLALGEIIPKDSTHVHFGKGQTEYEINLPPGKHKLSLQMADGLHRSYGSRMSTTINVTVKQ